MNYTAEPPLLCVTHRVSPFVLLFRDDLLIFGGNGVILQKVLYLCSRKAARTGGASAIGASSIAADYLPHPLSGKYKGCLKCHINGDFLLIWYDKNTNVIELVRLGSHSELFK